MPRLVHITPMSNRRRIERAGISGARRWVLDGKGKPQEVRHAVYAMPVTSNFASTYQWVRELRRWRSEQMVAVYFQLPSDEPVWVGRYGQRHPHMALGSAIASVVAKPEGKEIVVSRSLRPKEVVAIRDITQLVGWIETPEQHGKSDCVCPCCLSSGSRDLMQRLRAVADRAFTSARLATTPNDIVEALCKLEMPFERAKGRLPPNKLFRYTYAQEARVRTLATALLSHFHWQLVAEQLTAGLSDPHLDVRNAALSACIRSAGPLRTYEWLMATPDSSHLFDPTKSGGQKFNLLCAFVETLKWQTDRPSAYRLLQVIASQGDVDVRSCVETAVDWMHRDDMDA